MAQLHSDQRREARRGLKAEHHEGTAHVGIASSVVQTPVIDVIRQEHRASHGGSRAALLVQRGQQPLSHLDLADREMMTLSQVLHDAAQVRAEAQRATQTVAHDFERDFKPASSLRHAASLIVLKCTEIRYTDDPRLDPAAPRRAQVYPTCCVHAALDAYTRAHACLRFPLCRTHSSRLQASSRSVEASAAATLGASRVGAQERDATIRSLQSEVNKLVSARVTWEQPGNGRV